jgi:outer membrane receptor protein involved in Fe transport
VTLWGRNLLDKDYRYTSVDLMEQLGFGITHYADPRTYGVTLNWQTN